MLNSLTTEGESCVNLKVSDFNSFVLESSKGDHIELMTKPEHYFIWTLNKIATFNGVEFYNVVKRTLIEMRKVYANREGKMRPSSLG